MLEDRVLLFTFDDGNRWPSTGTDGGGLVQGDPTTLTWGFVADDPIYGIGPMASSTTPMSLFRTDPVTGVTTSIGLTGVNDLIGLTSDPNGNLYAIDRDTGTSIASRYLYQVDANTGVASKLYALGRQGGFGEGDLTFDAATNTIVAIDSYSHKLYRISLDPQATTRMSEITTLQVSASLDISGLAFRGPQLFGLVTATGSSATDRLVSINTSTGQITDVKTGGLGFHLGGYAGLTYDPSQDVFFIAGTNQPKLLSVNATTFVATPLNAIAVQGTAIPDISGLTFRIGVSNIPGFNGEPSASKLIESLDKQFGVINGGPDLTQRPWFPIFSSAFDRLGQLSGLTFQFEKGDDGSVFSNVPGSNPGLPGTRPDIRIGGHWIDGLGGKLANTFLPDIGDMIIDTADIGALSNSANNFLAFRDMLMHEASHAVGIDHVNSSNAAFLMEPSLDTSFDGPQLDDILALQRGYGDALEKGAGNNTSATATDLGVVDAGAIVRLGTLGSSTTVASTDTDFVSIDGLSDVDFFKFTITDSTQMTLKLTPRGTTYNQGPDTNPATPQSSFNSAAQSDLSLQLLDSNGSTVLQTANAKGLGGTESISGFSLAAGTYFVKVSSATDKVQLYGVDVSTPPVLSVGDPIPVSEGTGGIPKIVQFVVSLNHDTDRLVSVNFTTANHTALAGSDYLSQKGVILFAPGQTTKMISVPVLPDSRYEGNEDFYLNLSNPLNAGIFDGQGLLTIIDDDPIPSVTITDAAVTEGTGRTVNAVFTVILNTISGLPVTVDFSTADGPVGLTGAVGDVDYTTINGGSVTIPAGQTRKTFSVPVIGDALHENTETFLANVALDSTTATNAALVKNQVTGKIIDNDAAPLVRISNVTVNEGDDAVFTVKLSAPSGLDVTVSYATANLTAIAGSNFTSLPLTTITITAGNTTAYITVKTINDTIKEPTKQFQLRLSGAVNALFGNASGLGIILDIN